MGPWPCVGRPSRARVPHAGRPFDGTEGGLRAGGGRGVPDACRSPDRVVACRHPLHRTTPLNPAPDPKDLRGAAAVARTLAYAAGLAGVVAGGIVYRQGEVPFAVAIWVLTFAVGALLMIAAFLLHAMTAIMARLAAMEQDVRILVGRQVAEREDPRSSTWPT